MNELKNNLAFYYLYRNRPHPIPHGRIRSIVWPGRAGVAVPTIPFKPYDDAVRVILRNSDAANRRVENYLNELNGQRGAGVVVQHELRGSGLQGTRSTPANKRDIPDGKWEALKRQCFDLRDVDNEQIRDAAKTRWALCQNRACPGWFKDDCYLCMDRQRAGTCATLKGSDLRFNSPRNASVGGRGGD